MATGSLSPLQTTAGAGLLQNQGIAVNSEFITLVQEYEAVPAIANLVATLSAAQTANLSPATIASLQSLGASACPALGDSVPAASAGTAPFTTGSSLGFVGSLEALGNTYLGDGDVSKFAQAFATAQGFVTITNRFIITAENANEYLGPTFTDMNNLVTADFAKITSNLAAFGQDVENLGSLFDPSNITHLGEPAALLQQLSAVGNMGNTTLPCVKTALNSVGLTDQDISNLITDNRLGPLNPEGLTVVEFDKLQQRAYAGMSLVEGDCLVDVLDILGVDTPNLDSMADLLNPVKIFPTSYDSLKFGDGTIYTAGSVNSVPILQTAPTGCDLLAKIIPPAQALANKALQFQLQQVGGITNTTLPEIAAVLA